MTTISHIRLSSHCNDLGGKIWNPAIRWTQKYAVFVEVIDSNGQVGLGECWCFDTAPDPLLAFLRTEVIPHFIGVQIDDAFEVAQRQIERATLTARHGMLMSALSGIDIAIWDLKAQRADLPLWRVINPNAAGDFQLYGSGGLYGQNKTLQDLQTEMASMRDDGFHILKMKVGALSVEQDVARVKAALDMLPAPHKLIVDGVYKYTATTAMQLFEALPRDRIEAFQSPIAAHDYAGMAELVKNGVPVMATEAEYRDELHQKLVQEVRVPFLQTAPVAVGGISRLQQLQRLISHSETRITLEVSSTSVALIAACHLAAASKDIAHVERHYVHQVFFEQLNLASSPDSPGQFFLPEKPGLGCFLPKDQVTVHSTNTH
ncbi:enolase C-terminal domain-like protein [Aestuariibius sp. HNIBRBA575]|uniref:enolase C-terminal domain-like protein n=1 Tax=Aestuariibius sp. HNIBRBA575 TaxID=3233343 RepID=UPI0034A2DB41